ncbi:MAG: hypothetical protein ABL997_04690 [Planctomycetota bacterium]
MKLFANFDLYKGVILASLILLPGAAWWIQSKRTAIENANRALTEATKPGGLLEEIGKLNKQLKTVEENRVNTSSQTGSTDLYFQGQIFRSAMAGQLATDQFKINPPRDENVTAGQKQPVRDIIVKIDWLPRGGKDFTFLRDFLFAVLFNCESSARSPNSEPLPSIWKLYTLKMTNATIAKSLAQQLAPPAELADEWIVREMAFARREPRKER